MEKFFLHSPILVVTLTCLTLTQGQYIDVFQNLEQLFQPFQHQPPAYIYNEDRFTGPNSHEGKKRTENQERERRTKKPPSHQYEYDFSTTTPKPTRKTTKSHPGHSQSKQPNIRKSNSDIVFRDFEAFETTTKRFRVTPNNRIQTTTINYAYNNNRATTDNVLGRFNSRGLNNRPAPETNHRNVNTGIIFRDDDDASTYERTTKRNIVNYNNRPRPTTTTPINNVYDRRMFDNVGSNAFNRPVTENVFENNYRKDVSETHGNQQGNYPNKRRIDSNLDYNNNNRRVTANNWNPNTHNTNNNDDNNNRRVTANNWNPNTHNTNNNNNENNENNNRENNYGFETPKNSRNPNVHNINPQVRPTQNNRNHNFGTITSEFTNTGYPNRENSYGNNNFNSDSNNRVPPINFANWNDNSGIVNTDYETEASNDKIFNPYLNRPGVKPLPIDVNKPPITNKPVTQGPYDNGFGAYTERADNSPEILIGPDEEVMSERQKRRYINLAEEMCENYKSLNFKEIVALPLLPSPDPVQVNVSSCVPITAPLVIGGRVATINEFPHMAVVGWKKIRGIGYSWKCGGSLISNQYVLTAGHCTYQDKDYEVDSGPPEAVQLGSSYLDDPSGVVVRISAVVRHPKYKQRRSYYDIALIKMVQTVKFSEVIRPACLGVPPAVGRKVIATGWGRTEFGGDHSVELRSVSLPVWNLEECRRIWGTSLKLPNGPSADSQMCAGEKAGGKDTCQGDSGGPAQIQDGCVWRVVAVTSFGRSCGAPNTPALYAITHLPFIAAQVFGEEQEQGYGNQDRQPFDNRREPDVYNRDTGFVNFR